MANPQQILTEYNKLLSSNNKVIQTEWGNIELQGSTISNTSNLISKTVIPTKRRRKEVGISTSSQVIFLFQKDVTVTIEGKNKIVTKLFVGGDRDEPEEIYTLKEGYRFLAKPTINKTGKKLDDYIVNFILEPKNNSQIQTPDLYKFCAISGGLLSEVDFKVPKGFDGFDNYIAHQHGYFNVLQIEKSLPVELLDIGSFIFSGNGLSGNPKSSFNYYYRASIGSSDFVYYVGGAFGKYQRKTNPIVDWNHVGTQEPENTIDINASTVVSDFSGENNNFGVQLVGSFIEHPDLTPPSTAYAYLYFGLSFNQKLFKKFARNWDSEIVAIEDEIDFRESQLQDKIVPLTPEETLYTGLQRRLIYLAKAAQDTNLDSLITQIKERINLAPTGWIYSFRSLLLIKVLDDIKDSYMNVQIPSVLPQLLPDDEFFELPNRIEILASELTTALSYSLPISQGVSSFGQSISQALEKAKECILYGERARRINALPSLVGTGWVSYVEVRISGIVNDIGLVYLKNYEDNPLTTAPIEVEASIAGVPYTSVFNIDVGRAIRQSGQDFFFCNVEGLQTDSLPFGRASYINSIKWRKRGNTEWFSV